MQLDLTLQGLDKGTLISTPLQTPQFRQTSRAKLWIRTGIVTVFGVLFGLMLYRDLTTGIFPWTWAGAVGAAGLAIGYWMRRWVPMQVHLASQHVTLSFDRLYFALILSLVVVKAIAGNVLGALVVADGIMCIILGVMLGRLSGICLRVSGLKKWMRALPSPEEGVIEDSLICRR